VSFGSVVLAHLRSPAADKTLKADSLRDRAALRDDKRSRFEFAMGSRKSAAADLSTDSLRSAALSRKKSVSPTLLLPDM
jgi:hypothetical protein